MGRKETYIRKLDWVLVITYLLLVAGGWLSIYAATYQEGQEFVVTLSRNYGRQFMWITICLVIAFFILVVDSKFFTNFSFPIWVFTMFLLVAVLVFGQEVKGAKAWLTFGSIKIQPAEFAKFATGLALSKFMSSRTFKMSDTQDRIKLGLILGTPVALILLQNDTGSMLAYTSFFLMFYREGMSSWILITGVMAATFFILALLLPLYLLIGLVLVVILFFNLNFLEERREYLPKGALNIFWGAFILIIIGALLKFFGISDFLTIEHLYIYLLLALAGIIGLFVVYNTTKLRSINQKYILPLVISVAAICYMAVVDFAFNNILKPHQRGRIEVLLGMKQDPDGVGFHGIQSRMTISSGGMWGKGWLQGTRTAGGYVPEQSTDFIFCTIGEEFGFFGSLLVLGLFTFFLLRIVHVAERQRSTFSRVYGYCVASILFIHLVINLGMTMGLVPVIGIPLPFFSYGGSSLMAFTILVFIFIKLDSERLFLLR